MIKTILFLCYWFPPANIIGAVRPYQQVQYLISQGYKVIVICGRFSDIESQSLIESDMLEIITYENKISTTLSPNLKGKIESLPIRAVKFGLRNIFYPDQFITNKKTVITIVDNIVKEKGKPSLIISSALPFSMHVIANNISKRYEIQWIADHRDLWANSPYRKRFNSLRLLDNKYENVILKQASYNIVVGARMKEELNNSLKDSNISVVRNGADVSKVVNHSILTDSPILFSYTGILYGGFRSPKELFIAISLDDKLSNNSIVSFYGSEKAVVESYKKKFDNININYHDREPKDVIKSIQRRSHFLVIALGDTDFEKSVLTGKFYEYLETGRAIIALCGEDSDLAKLINTYQVGIATRNPSKILQYINSHKEKGFPILEVPEQLTRNYQNKILLKLIQELI